MEMKGEPVKKDIMAELGDFEGRPHLAVLLVGDDNASKSFIRKKRELCEELGFEFTLKEFPEGSDTEDVLEEIESLNEDTDIHGILPQLPLPGLSEHEVFEAIRPEKDVDGLSPENLGLLQRGNPRIVPGTVESIREILEEYEVEIEGRDITIVNNSNLIGKPLSMYMTNKKATVTLCHKETRDLKKHTETADILITATGQSGLIDREMIKENAIIVDAGYAKENGKVKGDVKFDEVKEKASKITPNPGGVGPVTVATTMRNLVRCYKIQEKSERTVGKRGE